MDFVKGLLVKLISRKLWLAVSGVSVLMLDGKYFEAAGVFVAYLAAQGYADGKTAEATGQAKAAEIQAAAYVQASNNNVTK